MRVSDLDYIYPEKLVAAFPRDPKRVMVAFDSPVESSLDGVLELFSSGDVLVINNTQVLKRRVFSKEGKEVLFLRQHSLSGESVWNVLFPSRSMEIGDVLELPEGVELRLLERGLPQKISVNKKLTDAYFLKNGEIPLPPYIQKARGERHNIAEDSDWYQTVWASRPGSFAAPTASLHFKSEHLRTLRKRGVKICEITLHVGLGTFMPIKVDHLDDHQMHSEYVEVPVTVWDQIQMSKKTGGQVWALGTTVMRSLEALSQGHLENVGDRFVGETDLLIQPGHCFQVVNRLLTNFHQPKSTLLALVSAFSGVDFVRSCYQWAIENEFLLFSYGDLSVWKRRSF